MYNGLFGFDPQVQLVLAALRVESQEVPRFRDAFFLAASFELMLYTRTGGANREFFAKENEALRNLAGFVRDEDDGLDSTYACWFYKVPGRMRAYFKLVYQRGGGRQPLPAERWRQLFADMKAGVETDDTRRAHEYGERVIKPQLEGALDDLTNRDRRGSTVIRIIET
jgi:hypothetical protein